MSTTVETKERRPYAQDLRWIMEEAMPTWEWDPRELTSTIEGIEAIVEDHPEALDAILPVGVLDMLVEEIRAIHDHKGNYHTHILVIRNTLLTNLALQRAHREPAGSQKIHDLSRQMRSSVGFNPDEVLG